MQPERKPTILSNLRCAILLSGERAEIPWWASNGLTSGAKDLRYAFPRTAMTAAVTRATALAKSLHDERTRQQGFHHLFRLPHGIEADVHQETLRLEQAGELTAKKIETFFNDFLEGASSGDLIAEGAVDCGKISILKQSDLKRLGALYREAFRTGKICLPYFELVA